MKKILPALIIVCLVLFALTGCENAESKALKEATGNFNIAVGEVQALQSNFASKVSEAEGLLTSTNSDDLADPMMLEKLQEELDAAKALNIDIPAIAGTAEEVSQQIQNITTLKDKLQAQQDSLDNAIKAINTSKQVMADRIAAEKAAEEQRRKESLEGAGILAVSYTAQPYSRATSATITAIDPVSGEATVVRKFPTVGNNYELPYPGGFFSSNSPFDANYKRLCVTTVADSSGARHVGWIDEDGIFTDVTAQITSPGGDFSGATIHRNGYFGPDDWLYFEDLSNYVSKGLSGSGFVIKRVPIASLNEESVEVLYNGSSGGHYVQPDGSIEYGAIYSDSTMKHCAHPEIFHTWVNPTTFVGFSRNSLGNIVPGKIYLYDGSPNREASDFRRGSNRREFLPNITNRLNYNATASPDGSQIAFLSFLETGSDPAEMFIVPSSGGEPTKVSTTYSFEQDLLYLLEWR
jgi:hypothetical protein